MTPAELEQHTRRRLDALARELEPAADADTIFSVGQRHFARLLQGATIFDFIPLLVYRATREELREARVDLHRAA